MGASIPNPAVSPPEWLKTAHSIAWRAPIPSLNYLLTSHVWRQEHNGFSHQDPGFIDHVLNKKPDVVRVYLPPDANTLLFVTDHCLRTWDRINVIVAGKQPSPQWLEMGTPFTDLPGAGRVNAWRAAGVRFLEWTIRGRSKRWTTGSVTMRSAGNTSIGFAGRTALFVPTAIWPVSLGRCPMDCCGVEAVTGVHP